MNEPKALVRNAGDPEQVKQAKETQKRREQREREELRQAVNHLPSARVFWRLLDRFGAFKSVLGSDPHMTYFNAGQQDVAHYLLAEILTADPDAYDRMRKDAEKIQQNIIEPSPRTGDSIEHG